MLFLCAEMNETSNIFYQVTISNWIGIGDNLHFWFSKMTVHITRHIVKFFLLKSALFETRSSSFGFLYNLCKSDVNYSHNIIFVGFSKFLVIVSF